GRGRHDEIDVARVEDRSVRECEPPGLLHPACVQRERATTRLIGRFDHVDAVAVEYLACRQLDLRLEHGGGAAAEKRYACSSALRPRHRRAREGVQTITGSGTRQDCECG